jgi:carboxyl-terminal processing protease
MSLKVRGLLAVSIGTVLGLSLSLGSAVLAERQDQGRGDLPWEEARLLAEVLERVKRDYVDEVDDERLMEAAIRGMLANLDPHSSYLNAEEYDEIRISTSGNYSGIGLELGIAESRVVVIAPMESSPAEAAGVVSGDVLLSIDGVPVDSSNLNDAVMRLRGDPGTEVRVAILHAGSDVPHSVALVRSQITVSTVHSEYIEPAIGYVRLTHFSETSAADLRRQVRDLSAKAGGRLGGMVLDLRNNPGGVLDAAIEISDAFLDDGLIVSAEGRVPDASFRPMAEQGDILDGAPLTVLVNGGSASASEIVAGALQDNHRATVIGTATFGKGSVQTVMPLSRGRAIKLTTSRYYTPSGRSIHMRGIAPDVVADPAVMAGADTDPQLSRALDFLQTQRVARSNTE